MPKKQTDNLYIKINARDNLGEKGKGKAKQ